MKCRIKNPLFKFSKKLSIPRLFSRRIIKIAKSLKSVNIKLFSCPALQTSSVTDFACNKRSAYIFMITTEKLCQ